MTKPSDEFYHLDRVGVVDEDTTFELEFFNGISLLTENYGVLLQKATVTKMRNNP